MSQSAERYYEFLTRDEALSGTPIDRLPGLSDKQRRVLKEAHRRMIPHLAVLTVYHLGHDNRLKAGQLVVHEALADNILARFANLRAAGFAIEKIKPHVMYGYDDGAAMADNNTSGYRPDFVNAARGSLSKHFVGVAVDIEPVHNKMRYRDGRVVPPYTPGYRERSSSMLMYRRDILDDWSGAGSEYGGTWPVAGIEKITGHPDFYRGAPADEHHFELRDAKLPSESHLLDMRDLLLPVGIIYEHPGRVYADF